MKREVCVSVLTILTITLSACGGGSGGDGSSSTPVATNPTPPVVVTPPPTITPANLQTTVPASTYAATSDELAFFNAFNDFRAKVGLGLLAQSKELDLASANHLNYLLTNSDIDFSKVSAHDETATRPGFTGVNSLERAKFAKYAGTFTAEQISNAYRGDGALAMHRLLATVYHRATMMHQGARDVGVKVGANEGRDVVMVLGGTQGNFQRNASDFVTGYPYDKQTGVSLTTTPESPNPYPDLTLNDYATKTSYPVSFTSEQSTTLKVETFTITEAGQSAPLDVRLITADNDYLKMLPANFAFIVGRAPFKANTTYNVSFKGTVNGAAVGKTWSFTTGS